MTNTPFEEALKLMDKTEPVELEFRLYYDDENKPLFYTMDNEEGNYININKDEFAECRYDVIVKDGKIKKVNGRAIGKLVPSSDGYGTLRDDVSIVGLETLWSTKTYD